MKLTIAIIVFFDDTVIFPWIYELYYGKREHNRGCESSFG